MATALSKTPLGHNRTTYYGTGAVAIDHTITHVAPTFYLTELKIHCSAAGGAGNLTITLDSILGAVYDAVLLTQDMTSIADLLWQPTRPILLSQGDILTVAWANAGTKTWGLLATIEGV